MMAENEFFQGHLREAQEQWQQVLEADNEKAKEFADAETIRVLVLVWGPGTGFERYYRKRQQIAQHINNAHHHNYALFSEDIFRFNNESKKTEIIPGEIDQARLAHIIIILEADPALGAIGSYAEKVIAATRRKIAPKVVDLIPEKFKPGTGKGGGLAQVITEQLRRNNIMYYSSRQFRECHDIRAFCERKVAEARLTLFFEYQREREGI